jgi:5'-methylthioadenosine phosphorylase
MPEYPDDPSAGGQDPEEEVTIEAILAVLHQNVGTARRIIQEAVTRIPAERSCPCPDAARYAIMTPAELIPPETRRSLELLYGKYLKGVNP